MWLLETCQRMMGAVMEDKEIHVRWMIRRDLPEVMGIERLCFDVPWTEDEFIQCLKQTNCIGMVADDGEHVLGFMLYELLKSELHVINFAVSPSCRRQGVGRSMVKKLADKLHQQKRKAITLEVRETNLAAQLFFSRLGLRATGVVRGYYEDTDEDAYEMTYRTPQCLREER